MKKNKIEKKTGIKTRGREPELNRLKGVKLYDLFQILLKCFVAGSNRSYLSIRRYSGVLIPVVETQKTKDAAFGVQYALPSGCVTEKAVRKIN